MSDNVIKIVGCVARFVPRRVAFEIYRLPSVARVVRAVLNLAVARGFQDVEVVRGPLAGTQFRLNLRLEKYLWLARSFG